MCIKVDHYIFRTDTTLFFKFSMSSNSLIFNILHFPYSDCQGFVPVIQSQRLGETKGAQLSMATAPEVLLSSLVSIHFCFLILTSSLVTMSKFIPFVQLACTTLDLVFR